MGTARGGVWATVYARTRGGGCCQELASSIWNFRTFFKNPFEHHGFGSAISDCDPFSPGLTTECGASPGICFLSFSHAIKWYFLLLPLP